MLTWTTEKPKVAGLYWYRRSLGLMGFIVEVELEGDTLTVDDTHEECRGAVATIEGQWAGPLESPL